MGRVMRNRLLVVLGIFLLLIMITYESDRSKIIDDLNLEVSSLKEVIDDLVDINTATNEYYDGMERQYNELLLDHEKLKESYNELLEKQNSGISRGLETKRSAKASFVLHATGYIANHGKAPYYGITKSGVKAKEWYTVAVDPSQFPLGTKFYIPEFVKYNGTGIFVAEDTGSAIDYGDIDICVPTVEECYSEIGSRKIEVFVIEYGTGKVNR